jgi:hypothetical protein
MNDNPFVGPGKLFATEDEEFDEYIAYLEWATQSPPEMVEAFWAAVRRELARREPDQNK